MTVYDSTSPPSASRYGHGWEMGLGVNMEQTRSSTASVALLKTLTYRITSTPSDQLPQVASHVASLIWGCRALLSAIDDRLDKRDDGALAAHRFRTSLTTLLQDRTVEGRWSAVVLVKAAIEAGGIPLVNSHGTAWVKHLLQILRKSGDPPSTRTLACICLTRLFMLTWDVPNLVREITTPSLPTFVSTCLANAQNTKRSGRELQTILESFTTILPRHPAIFRTSEAQIRTLCVTSITSYDVSSTRVISHYNKHHRKAARDLLVLLHHVAPKQGAGDKWAHTLEAGIKAAHTSCDLIFRSIQEQGPPRTGSQPSLSRQQGVAGECSLLEDDEAGFCPWSGIYAGADRLIQLLAYTSAHVCRSTSVAVNVKVGLVTELLARICAVTFNTRHNHEIAKDEREALYMVLPSIHCATLDLISTLLKRFGDACTSLTQALIEIVVVVFRTHATNEACRAAAYRVTNDLLGLVGPDLTKEDVRELDLIFKTCCNDILPLGSANRMANDASNEKTGYLSMLIPASQSRGVLPTHPTTFTDIQATAGQLLETALSEINPRHTPGSTRMLLDRTAILVRHKDAMVASVLNPSVKSNGSRQLSILPILARLFPGDAQVEALLRPRMPVIRTAVGIDAPSESEDDSENDEKNGVEDRVLSLDNMLDRKGVTAVEDDEPMSGLLSALSEDASVPMDYASAIPDPSAAGETFASSGTMQENKRPAITDEQLVPTAKRLRASPDAETLLPELAQELSGARPAMAQLGVPTTAHVAHNDGTQTVTLPKPFTQPQTADDHQSAEEDDDSDFEMPPLTMEPDTDPEDVDD